jgi:diguanylate cyclase (GGDEF)-like protein/PAS domain S-box-containing protein
MRDDTGKYLILGAQEYLQAVSDLAVALAAAPPDATPYRIIAERLCEVSRALLVVVGSYDAATEEVHAQHVAGDAAVLRRVEQAIGCEVAGLHRSVPAPVVQAMLNAGVQVMDEPIVAVLGLVDSARAHGLREALGAGPGMLVLFRHAGEVVGAAALLLPAGQVPLPRPVALAFANVAAVALRRKTAEDALRISEEKFARAFHAIPDAVSITDLETARFVEVNDALLRVAGRTRAEFVGRTAEELGLDPGRRVIERVNAEVVGHGSVRAMELPEPVPRPGRGRATLLVSAERIDVGGRPCVLTITRDISDRKHMEQELTRLAYRDPVTDLPNRMLLHDRLEQAISRSRRVGKPAAVAILDLDRFKEVNDTLGHAAGDVLLRRVAERLRTCVRRSDTVARFGGDEFGLVLLDVNGFAGALRVAQRIRASFGTAFALEGREVHTSASIGIALHPGDGDDPDALLKNADIAMYRAKDAGRNTYQFFESAMSAAAAERATLEDALRGAAGRGELLLHYQPQVRLAGGQIVGVEALVRWRHPERGMISPGTFIPLAEETGIIVPLGDWVLREALRQAHAWQGAGLQPPRVAINVSPRQLREPDFPERVAALLAEIGVAPDCIELEITETAVMENIETCVGVLDRLRAIGVHIALDDFGTGYSSLTHLRRLPIDTLKIGQVFVRDITDQPQAAALVSAVVFLGRTFHIDRLVVEGIETPAQLALLRGLGCDTAQGYLFARPEPPAAVGEKLRQGRITVPGTSDPPAGQTTPPSARP